MAASHACQSCGLELARTRAGFDAELGMLVVSCPRCRRSTVRSRPDILTLWRSWRGTIRSVAALAVQTLVGALMVGAAVGAVMVMQVIARDLFGMTATRAYLGLLDGSTEAANPAREDRAALAVYAAMLVCASVGAGSFFASGLSHWRRRWWCFAAWAGTLGFILILLPLTADRYSLLTGQGAWLRAGQIADRAPFILVSTLLAVAGLPVGRGLRRAASAAAARRRSSIRRRRRRLRESLR